MSVYDKTDLIDFARGLQNAGVRLLGSGGTAKKIRDAGIPIEYAPAQKIATYFLKPTPGMFQTSPRHQRCWEAASKRCILLFMEVGVNNTTYMCL